MKRSTTILLGLIFLAVSASSAEAIKVSIAYVQDGVAVIQGGQATPNAMITWEGGNVRNASANGAFNFSGVVPPDCIGTLSDGVSTVVVALADCIGEILATGQTVCSDAIGNSINCTGTGQDGEFRTGAARSYTDNGNGTITDNATGLVWEKLTNDVTIHNVNNSYTWDLAFQKITDLNIMKFGGYEDWRLPNLNELLTLVDYGRFGPATNPAFNNKINSFTRSSLYWSSTSFQYNRSNGWYVDFKEGKVKANGKTNFHYVRAVRGGW
jgi:hypothetical protein